jgi:hypothetical protein
MRTASRPKHNLLSFSFNDAPIDLLSVNFTGRTKELALIASALRRVWRNVPRRCALHGNQGVGKSQLTYKWAKFTFDSEENHYIMRISTTTVEKLYQRFCRLLHYVNHPDRSHPEQSVRLAAARQWFEGVDTGNWLLVLDNVFPETLDFLRQHLPCQNGRGSILFTTCTETAAVALHMQLEVPLLSVQDGVELFLEYFLNHKTDIVPSKVEEIVKTVGCLPLAISHTAAYMKETGISVDDMLKLYQGRHRMDVSLGNLFTGATLILSFKAHLLGK